MKTKIIFHRYMPYFRPQFMALVLSKKTPPKLRQTIFPENTDIFIMSAVVQSHSREPKNYRHLFSGLVGLSH